MAGILGRALLTSHGSWHRTASDECWAEQLVAGIIFCGGNRIHDRAKQMVNIVAKAIFQESAFGYNEGSFALLPQLLRSERQCVYRGLRHHNFLR